VSKMSIPVNWRLGKLGDPEVAEIIMGQSPPGSTYNTNKDGLPFFQGKTDFGEKYPTPRIWCSEPKKISEKGDILISVRAPVGPTNWTREKCCIGRGLAAIRTKIIPEYVYYYLKFLEPTLLKSGTGSTFKSIGKQYLYDISIPVAPLETQKKIIQKLDHVLVQLEEKKKFILQFIKKNNEQLELLNNNLLLDFIEKSIPLHRLPVGWKLESLSNVCMVERGKFGHRPRNDPEYYGGKYPFIQTGDITNSNGRISTYKQTLNEKGLKVSRMFPKGTVVITIAANIGDTAILDFDSCFPDSIIGITPKKDKAIPEYVEYVLRLYKFDLEKNASKGAQKNINYGFLKPLMIPIPPQLDLQYSVVKKIKDAELKINQLKNNFRAIADKYQKIKKYLDDLDSTILNRAFTGKLVN